MPKSRLCKICGSETILVFNRGWSGKPYNLSYYRCNDEKCIFLHTDYIDNWSDEQISKMYEGHICGGGDQREYLPLDKVNLAKVILPNAHKILDVGSGEGLGVSVLRKAGFEAYGYDVVPPNVCQEYITTGDRACVGGTYDVVTAIEVLEHLIEPVDTCRWIASLLKEGGVFAFSTYTFDPNRHDANWWYLDIVGHVSLHTRSSLRLLAEASGFTVVTDVFSTHVWIRKDSIPTGAATKIKTKHVLKKLLDSQSYQVVWNRIKTKIA